MSADYKYHARCCLCGAESFRHYEFLTQMINIIEKDDWLVAHVNNGGGNKYQFICDRCRYKHNMWKIKFDETKLHANATSTKLDDRKYSHDFIYSDAG